MPEKAVGGGGWEGLFLPGVPVSWGFLSFSGSSAQRPEAGLVEEGMASHRRPGILTISLSEPRDSWRLRLETQLRSEAWLLSVERWVER